MKRTSDTGRSDSDHDSNADNDQSPVIKKARHHTTHERGIGGPTKASLPGSDTADTQSNPAVARLPTQKADGIFGNSTNSWLGDDSNLSIQRSPQTPLDAFDEDEFNGEFLVPPVTEELIDEHPVDFREHGQIPPGVGRDITGSIRASLNSEDEEDLTDRENRNVGIAVAHTEDGSFAMEAISGDQAPGATMPVTSEDERRFEPDLPWMDNHTEPKLLEGILKQVEDGTEGVVYMFTERAPCPSCKSIIKEFK